MKTYLLTWNPKYYDATRVEEVTEQRGTCYMHWSTNCMKIEAGDAILLMRQGKEPRGIVGFGYAHEHKLYLHEDGRWYVAVVWGYFKREKPLLTLEELRVLFPDQHWSPRGSGIEVKPPAGDNLPHTLHKIINEKGDR